MLPTQEWRGNSRALSQRILNTGKQFASTLNLTFGKQPVITTFDALHRLIKNSDILSLSRELDSGVSPNLSNQFSWTLLMLTALEGNTSIGELLISRGADVNATNNSGETALSLAAHNGHIRFIQGLLAHGATTNCRPHGSRLEDWLRVGSGLPEDKIASMLALISSAKS